MTAEDVKAALRARWGECGAIAMEEVGSSTGGTYNTRYCDMVFMETWPSRGLAIVGIEVKVSKYDWLRELANPAKAEAIHRYCDEWWLAVTPGVVEDLATVPTGWGVIEVSDDLAGKRVCKVLVKPERLPRQADIPRVFVAAMLRAMQRADGKRITAIISESVQRQVEERREADAARMKSGRDRLAKMAAILDEAAKGAGNYIGDEEMARAIGLVLKLNLASSWEGITGLFAEVARAEEHAKGLRIGLEREMKAAGIDVPDHVTRDLRQHRKRRAA